MRRLETKASYANAWVDKGDEADWTALMLACQGGHEVCARALVVSVMQGVGRAAGYIVASGACVGAVGELRRAWSAVRACEAV